MEQPISTTLFDKIKHFVALTIPIILTQFAITGGSFVSVVLEL